MAARHLAVRAAAPPPVAGCPAGMACVAGATFAMGSEQRDDERPVHSVTLASFCLDVHEVTVADHGPRPRRASTGEAPPKLFGNFPGLAAHRPMVDEGYDSEATLMSFYYQDEQGQQSGPWSEGDMVAAIQSQRIRGGYVAAEGGSWQPLDAYPTFAHALGGHGGSPTGGPPSAGYGAPPSGGYQPPSSEYGAHGAGGHGQAGGYGGQQGYGPAANAYAGQYTAGQYPGAPHAAASSAAAGGGNKKLVIGAAVGVVGLVLVGVLLFSGGLGTDPVALEGHTEIVSAAFDATSKKLTMVIKVPKGFESFDLKLDLKGFDPRGDVGKPSKKGEVEATFDVESGDSPGPGKHKLKLTVYGTPEGDGDADVVDATLSHTLSIDATLTVEGNEARCGSGCVARFGFDEITTTLPEGTTLTVGGKTFDASARKAPYDLVSKHFETSGTLIDQNFPVPFDLVFGHGQKLSGKAVLGKGVFMAACQAKLASLVPGKGLTMGSADAASGKARALWFKNEKATSIIGTLTRCSDIDLVVDKDRKFRTVGNCTYVGNSGSRRNVTREAVDYQITVYDRRTGKQVGTRLLRGGTPPSCPSTIAASDNYIFGAHPTDDGTRYIKSLVGAS